jgi:hypothetical protein
LWIETEILQGGGDIRHQSVAAELNRREVHGDFGITRPRDGIGARSTQDKFA